jgi:hypothetical protein
MFDPIIAAVRKTDGVKASVKLFLAEALDKLRGTALPGEAINIVAELEAKTDAVADAIVENTVKPRDPEVVPQKVTESGAIVDMGADKA